MTRIVENYKIQIIEKIVWELPILHLRFRVVTITEKKVLEKKKK